METTAQFDLNKAIEAWREEVAASPAFRPGDAEELEVHLRDSILVLEGKGLAAHEAFWVAKSRLGAHESLAAEFGKVNVEQVWIDRLLWMLTGSIVLGLVSGLSNGLIVLASSGIYWLAKQPVVVGPVSLLLRLAMPALLVWFFWESGRHREGFVWRLGRQLKATPRTTALLAMLLTLLVGAISAGAHFLSVKVMPRETYSSFLLWTYPSSVAFTLIIPLILGWLLTRANRAKVLE